MIVFKVHLKQQQDLADEDASLSLGWFEIHTKGLNIAFFKDGYCMVFLTLSSLIDHLNNLEKLTGGSQRWIGEDHGGVIEMSRKKDLLELITNDIYIRTSFSEFKSAVISETKDFIDHCKKINSAIQNESAFEDLVHSIQ